MVVWLSGWVDLGGKRNAKRSTEDRGRKNPGTRRAAPHLLDGQSEEAAHELRGLHHSLHVVLDRAHLVDHRNGVAQRLKGPVHAPGAHPGRHLVEHVDAHAPGQV